MDMVEMLDKEYMKNITAEDMEAVEEKIRALNVSHDKEIALEAIYSLLLVEAELEILRAEIKIGNNAHNLIES